MKAGIRSRKWRVAVFAALLAAASSQLLHASAMSMSSGDAEAGEGAGIQVTLDGRLLPNPGIESGDLSELRVQVRDVAEALNLPVKWDAKHHAAIVGDGMYPASDGMDGSMAGSMGHAVVWNGERLPADVDPMLMGRSMTAVADSLAEAIGLSYKYDAGRHRIELLTPEAAEQFEAEKPQVEDVLNGKGMTPTIAADGTKEFTLTAELHDWVPVDGVMTTAWTFNGQAPGPTIRVTEGDRVRIHFVNHLPEPATIHWHGVLVPNEMDGVPGLTQEAVQAGGTFDYEFTASHAGTFIYHSHYDDMKQVGNGMYGAFIIDPKTPAVPAADNGELTAQTAYDHDYTMLLSGFHVNTTPEDEEDYFTMNGVSYPDTPPLNVKKGETVRIRLINIDTMETHTMHLHGMDFRLIARNGSPLKSVETMNTLLIGPGETADIALRADAVGKWMFHCHILDHTMNGGDAMGGMSMGEMGGLISILNVTE
ncbi:multicopper oxidase domain-containing protein [Cohnella zeiphila]|uniref:Copper-containing nitrite reductase n=1 Tax=Cohnella zeiphila TaxID=2761120 RepID=A0A7X0SH36_9BACL|nr:multicopper oxidase domain-containing protein [Cohnella zeiphila]MBB6729867.1 multicopper oxidase domain-containing protein [Cohnella zeiphila]